MTAIDVVGMEIEVEYLDEGAFSQVFFDSATQQVFVLTDVDTDAHKLLLCDLVGRSVHFPDISYHGKNRYGKDIFTMPFYEDICENWELYELISRLEDSWNGMVNDYNLYEKDNQDINPDLTQQWLDNTDMPDSLRDALSILARTVHAEYPFYSFDIAPRNVGLDAAGNIILYDVMFDPT